MSWGAAHGDFIVLGQVGTARLTNSWSVSWSVCTVAMTRSFSERLPASHRLLPTPSVLPCHGQFHPPGGLPSLRSLADGIWVPGVCEGDRVSLASFLRLQDQSTRWDHKGLRE